MSRTDRRIAAFTAAFFAVTALTIAHTRWGGGLALVWPGTAIVAALLIGLPRVRWGRAIAAAGIASTVATALFGLGPAMAVPLAAANMLEAYVVARLLIAVRPRRDWFDSVGGLACFVAMGGLLGPAAAAWPGAWAISHVVPGTVLDHAISWWTAHGLGTLIGLPLVLIMTSARFGAWERWSFARSAELAALLVLVGAVAAFAIGQSRLPVLFLPVLPLLVAAFRHGREGAVLGTLVIAGTAAATMHSPASPLTAFALDLPAKALFVQFYLATLSLIAVPVAVALRQYQLLLGELENRRALIRLVADHADVALLHLSPGGDITYASPAAMRLDEGAAEREYGAALEGRPLAGLFDPLDAEVVAAALAEAVAAPGKNVRRERAVLRNDEQLWLELRICAIAVDGQGAAGSGGFAVTIRNVTAHKQVEIAATAAAETDALTGLPNRRALLATLERALPHAERRPFALAILDLDFFKTINDTHGHNVGDTVLREVAGTLARLAGPGRRFARLGGEEFALIAADPGEAHALCEEARIAIARLRPRGVSGRPLDVTVSIGLAQIAMPQGAAQALEAADRLLYRAKRQGRDRVVTAAGASAAGAKLRAA